jgi:hypothetical protein
LSWNRSMGHRPGLWVRSTGPQRQFTKNHWNQDGRLRFNKKRRGIRVLISAVGDMIDDSEASPAGGGARRAAQRHGQRLTRARWPGRPNAPNSMGFLPTGTEWNDELTQGVLVWRGWLKPGVRWRASSLKLSDGYRQLRWSSGHRDSSYGGGGSWGSSSGSRLGTASYGWARWWRQWRQRQRLIIFWWIIKDHRGVFIHGKTPSVLRKISMADSVAIWPYPTRIVGWIQKGDKLPLVIVTPRCYWSSYSTSTVASTIFIQW